MNNKFPINHSFQRLINSPLDSTVVFDTISQAEKYANNNPTSYKGQIIHIKDARTPSEIENNINVYEASCYIDNNNKIKPICPITYKTLGTFFDMMNDILNDMSNNQTESSMDKLDSIYNAIYKDLNEENDSSNDENYKPYLLQPWVDSNYNTRQICLEMTQETTGDVIGCYGYYNEDAYFKTAHVGHTTENIVVDHNGVNEYYKIITLLPYDSPHDNLPTQVKFKNGNYIKRVVHMCNTCDITDMSEMFYGCENLINIKDINSWNVERVTNMNSMFYNCHNLVDLDIGNWNVYKVANMSKMFYNCQKLKTLDLTYWDIWNVEDLSYIFDGCISLTGIDLSRWCAYTMLTITGMFQNCESLTTLDLREFDCYQVNNVNYLFKGCKSLTSLNLTNWNAGADYYNAKETFEGCVSLELSNIKFTRVRQGADYVLTESYKRSFGG